MRDEHLIALGRVQRERDTQIHVVELDFVKHPEAKRGQRCIRRDLELARHIMSIAQPPAADIDGLTRGVAEFDGIFERQVGMRENFVHDHVGQRQKVAVLRGLCFRKRNDDPRAIGEASLRDAGHLRTERDGIDLRAVIRGEEEDGIAVFAELEVDVFGTGWRGRVVRLKPHESIRAHTRIGKVRDAVRIRISKSVRQAQSAQGDRSRIAVKEFKPIIAARRVRHPFVDPQQRGITHDRSHIDEARSREREDKIRCSRRHATDGEVGSLQSVFEAIDNFIRCRSTIEEINRTAVRVQSKPGVGGRRWHAGIRVDDEVPARGDNGASGKYPPRRTIVQLIAQAHPAEIDRGGRRIIELDPVGRPTIDGEAAGVVGQHFVNHEATDGNDVGDDHAIQPHAKDHVLAGGRRIVNLNREDIHSDS